MTPRRAQPSLLVPCWALLLASLAVSTPARGQERLTDLERRYQRAVDAHHDLGVQAGNLSAGLRLQKARLEPLTARIAELKRAAGPLARAELKETRRTQNHVSLEIVRARRALRQVQQSERVARLDLILAGCDYSRKLLALANRDTARLLGDESAQRTGDRQARDRLTRARRVIARLQLLKALEDPQPISFESLFGPTTPTSELRSLQGDCLELGDLARQEAGRLGRVATIRRSLLAELRRSLGLLPELSALVPLEEAALGRLALLRRALEERARRCDAEVARVQAEITTRTLRALREELRRRG